jgi:hypothetical protein
MKLTAIAVMTAAMLSIPALVLAADSPGKQMKQGSEGPGASEYAPPSGTSDTTPGQQMQEDTGPGASQYSPGKAHGDDAPGKSADAPGHTKHSTE